jgi:hypothetical protein
MQAFTNFSQQVRQLQDCACTHTPEVSIEVEFEPFFSRAGAGLGSPLRRLRFGKDEELNASCIELARTVYIHRI